MLTSSAIIKQLEAVHLAFQVGAIDRLYPGLGPEERPVAVARERMRDAKFVINMRDRIKDGVKEIRQNKSLTPDEKETKIAVLTATELRYMRQHINAATWRLQSEADVSNLKAQGEKGAYWKLGVARNHTEDCVRMAGKWWPWPVLEKINPANRHVGCKCKLISAAAAERQGLPVRMGRSTASVTSLHEADDTRAEAEALAAAYIRRGAELRVARLAEHGEVDPYVDPRNWDPRNWERQSTIPAEPVAVQFVAGEEKPVVSRGTPPGPFRPSPPPLVARNAERDAGICEMWATEGLGQSEIGRRVGLTQPRVRAILLARFGAEALRQRGKSGTRHDLAAA